MLFGTQHSWNFIALKIQDTTTIYNTQYTTTIYNNVKDHEKQT
jgi:hypothetical protein